jgi:hypothetical protein
MKTARVLRHRAQQLLRRRGVFPVERLLPKSNVRFRLRDPDGVVIQEREGHNVFTNAGRQWQRDLSGFATFPASPAAGIVQPYSRTDHRAAYIGVGSGGLYSTDPETASQDEIAAIQGIEAPLQVTSGVWLAQVVPQGDVAPEETLPNNYTIRFIRVFGLAELNNIGDSQGAEVSVSEAGLFTTMASPGSEPDPDSAVGMVAYHVFKPIPVTYGTGLEAVWELRF